MIIFDLTFMVDEETDNGAISVESPAEISSSADYSGQDDVVPNLSRPHSRSSSAATSDAIPLPSSHVHRTQSELQFDEDKEVAEQRDSTMFYRLVNGIRERNGGDTVDDDAVSHSERCLRNIIHTRLSNVQARSVDAHHSHLQRQWLGAVDRARTQISTISEASPECADDWSISGFNEQQKPLDQPPPPQAVQLRSAGGPIADPEDEIFALDP
jgi:hypothetical protein